MTAPKGGHPEGLCYYESRLGIETPNSVGVLGLLRG